MKKVLELDIEQAKSLYLVADKGLKKLLEANFPELGSKVLDRWEDLGEVSGYYSNQISNIMTSGACDVCYNNKNIHPTKEDVESCIALAQLQQLILRTGDGVSYEEWRDDELQKYVIMRVSERATIDYSYRSFYELAFKTKHVAEEFLRKHLPLINTYLKIK